jgi:TonB family protein
MLSLLIESAAPSTWGAWPSRLGSAVFHAGIAALAVLATTQEHPAHNDRGIVLIPTIWQAPHAPATTGSPAAEEREGIVPAVSFRVPAELPPIDLQPPGLPEVGFDLPERTVDAPLFGTERGTGAIAGSAIIESRVADEPPRLLSHPAPRYPEVLRQAGIEGRVLVEVVLDTLGHAEPASVRVVGGAHELFEREAVSVVLASRYVPGRVQQQAVRVRIQVPVSFSLRR